MSSKHSAPQSKLLIALVSALVVFTTPLLMSTAQAKTPEQPSEKSIKQLMQVTHVDRMIEQAASQNAMLIPQYTRQVIGSKAPQLNDEQKTRLNAIANDYIKQMLKDLNSEQAKQQMVNDYIKIAQKHYSQEEVDAQVTFYGSSLGQSIIKKQPMMMQDYMQTIMPAIIKRTDSSMRNIAPKLEADINNVLTE